MPKEVPTQDEDEALPNLPNTAAGGAKGFIPDEEQLDEERLFDEAGGNVSRHRIMDAMPESYYASPDNDAARAATAESNSTITNHLKTKENAQALGVYRASDRANDTAEQAAHDASYRYAQMLDRLPSMVSPQTPPRLKSGDNDQQSPMWQTPKGKKPSKKRSGKETIATRKKKSKESRMYLGQ